jgi:excisionase family DNA binding protein
MARPQRLTADEIQRAFGDEAARAKFPPILSPEQFAELFGVSVSTTYFWISQGLLRGAITKVGKHRRIWRNRAVEILFNRNQPKEQPSDDNHP